MALLGGRGALRKALVVAGVPVLVHVLACVFVGAWIVRAPREPAFGVRGFALGLASLAEAVTLFEGSAEPPVVSLAVESEVLPESLPALRAVRVLEQQSSARVETAPRLADGVEPRPPSHDRSAESLSTPRGLALGRDQVRLRSVESDGAQFDRPMRTRTGRSFASPEPERRVRDPGEAELSRGPRSEHAGETRAEHAREKIVSAVEESLLGESVQNAPSQKGRVAVVRSLSEDAPRAEAGPLRFEANDQDLAQDRVSVRGGSTATLPAPIEAGRPGASGAAQPGGIGHGPPGAVAEPRQGDADAPFGAPVALTPGPEVGVLAEAEARASFLREIRRRASQALRFPKRLALQLLQGDTILRFVVGKDGQVSGPIEMVKSAGFPEFDEEARAAVARAAPFPKMPEPLTVTIRFVFENPVVR